MNKLDNIFLRIINNRQFGETIGQDAVNIKCIDEGKRAANKQIRAIAEILDQLNKKIEMAKVDMRIRGKAGVVELDNSEYAPIYKKILSMLTN